MCSFTPGALARSVKPAPLAEYIAAALTAVWFYNKSLAAEGSLYMGKVRKDFTLLDRQLLRKFKGIPLSLAQ